MTNEQLIKSRWQFTDKLLKQYQKDFKLIFNDIKDELVELFNELNIDRDSLNKTISSSIKRKLERNKKEWKEANIITPYFQFLIDTTTKLTNSNVLKLFVFAIYLKYQQKELNKSKKLFVEVANDIFNQAKQETNIEPEKEDLLWKNIRDWTIVQTINIPFDEYLGVLNQTASEESSRLFIDYINSDLILDDSGLSKLIEKQKNRLILINEEKYSGVLENISRQVGNRAYFEPFPNQLVKFVAEVDDKTTKMCLSMNDFIFNTKDRNVFYRYSAATNTKVKYEIDGLVEGINLPPIMDHFHWCRSTLTYQIDNKELIDKYRRQLKESKYKEIGTIDLNKLGDDYNDYIDKIVLTNERLKHIQNEHFEVLDYIKKLPNIIKNPDSIYIDNNYINTLWFIKKVDKYNLKITIKLMKQNNKKDLLSSIINYQIIKEKSINNGLKNGRLKMLFKNE